MQIVNMFSFIAVWDIKGKNFLLLAESEKADNVIFLSHKVVFQNCRRKYWQHRFSIEMKLLWHIYFIDKFLVCFMFLIDPKFSATSHFQTISANA